MREVFGYPIIVDSSMPLGRVDFKQLVRDSLTERGGVFTRVTRYRTLGSIAGLSSSSQTPEDGKK